MLKNYHDEKIYNYLLQCFYLRVYCLNDPLTTQNELSQTFNTSLTSVKKAILRLRAEGFVETNKALGTVVSFDADNIEHTQKVAMYKSQPDITSPDNYILPKFLLSQLLTSSLSEMDSTNLEHLAHLVYEMSEASSDFATRVTKLNLFLNKCIELEKNIYLKSIANAYFNNYIFLNIYENFNAEQIRIASEAYTLYFGKMKHIIQNRRFERIMSLTFETYERLYTIPNILVFAKKVDTFVLFEPKTHKERVIDYILFKCLKKGLSTGSLITSEVEIIKDLKIPFHALRSVTQDLENSGLICKIKPKGIVLTVDFLDKEKSYVINNIIEQKWKAFEDACTIIDYINLSFCKFNFDLFTPLIITIIKDKIQKNKENRSECDVLFIEECLMLPIIYSKADNQLLRVSYEHMYMEIQALIELAKLDTTMDVNAFSNTHIYAALELLLKYIEEQDFDRFIAQIITVQKITREHQRAVAKFAFNSWVSCFSTNNKAKRSKLRPLIL